MLCSIEAYLFKKIYFGLIEVHQLKCKPYLHQKVSLEKIEIFFSSVVSLWLNMSSVSSLAFQLE